MRVCGFERTCLSELCKNCSLMLGAPELGFGRREDADGVHLGAAVAEVLELVEQILDLLLVRHVLHRQVGVLLRVLQKQINATHSLLSNQCRRFLGFKHIHRERFPSFLLLATVKGDRIHESGIHQSIWRQSTPHYVT